MNVNNTQKTFCSTKNSFTSINTMNDTLMRSNVSNFSKPKKTPKTLNDTLKRLNKINTNLTKCNLELTRINSKINDLQFTMNNTQMCNSTSAETQITGILTSELKMLEQKKQKVLKEYQKQ